MVCSFDLFLRRCVPLAYCFNTGEDVRIFTNSKLQNEIVEIGSLFRKNKIKIEKQLKINISAVLRKKDFFYFASSLSMNRLASALVSFGRC